MKVLITILSIIIFSTVTILAQNIPICNVYAFKMEKKGPDNYYFSKPRYLTGFNANGYNNQPHFINEHTLYLTVQFPEESQTDIYALDLLSKKKTQITATIEGEYSPTLMPDGKRFSVVRVEADGKNSQRLWQLPLDRSSIGTPILPDVTDVGYHYWINDQKIAFYLVRDSGVLVITDRYTGVYSELLKNIGRSFQLISGDKLAFIHKESSSDWSIKEMDTFTYRFKTIIKTLPNSEDFLYLPDGTFIMGNGSKLYRFKPAIDTDWKEMVDLKYFGIQNITRLAINKNGTIAIVDKKR